MAGAGGCAFAWPFAAGLAPPDPLEADPVVRVPTDDIAPGTQRRIAWRGLPIVVLRRSGAEIAALRAPDRSARLLDPFSRATQQPGFATGPTRSLDPAIGVLVGICTHLGCLPDYRPSDLAGGGDGGLGGGFLCPCHGSRFDLAGRVLTGSPARLNLPVPPYRPVPGAVLVGDRGLDPGFGLDRVRAL